VALQAKIVNEEPINQSFNIKYFLYSFLFLFLFLFLQKSRLDWSIGLGRDLEKVYLIGAR